MQTCIVSVVADTVRTHNTRIRFVMHAQKPTHLQGRLSSFSGSWWWVWWWRLCPAVRWWRRAEAAVWRARKTRCFPSPAACAPRFSTSPSCSRPLTAVSDTPAIKFTLFSTTTQTQTWEDKHGKISQTSRHRRQLPEIDWCSWGVFLRGGLRRTDLHDGEEFVSNAQMKSIQAYNLFRNFPSIRSEGYSWKTARAHVNFSPDMRAHVRNPMYKTTSLQRNAIIKTARTPFTSTL